MQLEWSEWQYWKSVVHLEARDQPFRSKLHAVGAPSSRWFHGRTRCTRYGTTRKERRKISTRSVVTDSDGRSHLPNSWILFHLAQTLHVLHCPLQKYGSYHCARGPQSSYFRAILGSCSKLTGLLQVFFGQSYHARVVPPLVALSAVILLKRALTHGYHSPSRHVLT